MHIPPRRYEPGPPTAASLPEEDRWSCHRPGPTPEIPEYCQIKHRSPETAARHSEKLNEALPAQLPGLEARYQPQRLHRIERYAVEELRYRGWTDLLVQTLLGEPDARDDIQRMADAKAKREHTRRERRNTPRQECLQHAADRCSSRSKPANAFFRQHRRSMHGHEASRILDARLAEAAAALMPFLAEYLERRLDAVRIRPETGAEVFWGRGPRLQNGYHPLPEKLHNLTNLRWARYLENPPSGTMPPLGTVTVTTADGSLPQPYVHVHPAPRKPPCSGQP